MDIKVVKGREAFALSLKRASVMFTNPDNTLQALFERDGDNFLCIIKKYGSKTVPGEAISLTLNEYAKSFGKCIEEKWFLNLFSQKKIITWR